MPEPSALLTQGRLVLASQPFSLLLGAEMHVLSPGLCELHLPITEQLRQQNGFAHGGVVSYCADNALAYAGGAALGAELQVPVVTSEFKINFARPALGQRLVARARAEYVGQSQAVCRCDVFVVNEGGEKLCAMAQGTIARLGHPAAVPL